METLVEDCIEDFGITPNEVAVSIGVAPRRAGSAARLQGRDVDHEAVPHVGGDNAVPGLVDPVRADELGLRLDAVLGAVVEHLLRLR